LEDPGGDAFTLARQAQQQMLSAEPVAFQAHRFTAGQAQHEGEGLGGPEVQAHARLTLTRADGFPTRTPADGLLDPAADRLWRDPHDLRHTAVALWIAAGASPKEVAA
jgi:hypothetical protein